MQTTTVRLYSLGYGQAKTYWTAFLFVAGNVPRATVMAGANIRF